MGLGDGDAADARPVVALVEAGGDDPEEAGAAPLEVGPQEPPHPGHRAKDADRGAQFGHREGTGALHCDRLVAPAARREALRQPTEDLPLQALFLRLLGGCEAGAELRQRHVQLQGNGPNDGKRLLAYVPHGSTPPPRAWPLRRRSPAGGRRRSDHGPVRRCRWGSSRRRTDAFRARRPSRGAASPFRWSAPVA